MITEALKIEKRSSARSQISNYLRDAIRRGNIQVGSKLPTTQEMANNWNTPVANVHAALAPLVKEGLLIRKQGVGTIVNNVDRKLETVAVYLKQNLGQYYSFFSRLLMKKIQEKLNSMNIECRVFFENNEKSAFAQIVDLAETRQIQGLIVPSADRHLLPELQKLPVPFSCMSSARVKNRVEHRYSSMIDLVIESMRHHGRSRLGIICGISDCINPVESGEQERHKFYQDFFTALDKAGIDNRSEWNVIIPSSHDLCESDRYNHFAFEAINKIWNSPEKPDALYVYPDDLIMGALLAITTLNVRVPDDLHLILHRNSGYDVLCPLPCTFIENDVDFIADSLIKLVEDQFNGIDVSGIEYDYRIVEYNILKENERC